MAADNRTPGGAHAHDSAPGPLVYGLFPADFTYRITSGMIAPYEPTTHRRRKGEFDEELERLGFPHPATAWGVSGTELTARIYERHPARAGDPPLSAVVPERILIVVELNCVERYYLAVDLHDALPFLAQLATTSSALAQSITALHQREERLRREALLGGLAGPMEQIVKALRDYVESEMLDDMLAREEATHAQEPPALDSDVLAQGLQSDQDGPDSAAPDSMLTDLLRRRSRQRKNTTND
jgi:hypothetical protein